MPDYLVALAAQVPLVAGFFFALQREWVYIGASVNRERAALQAEAILLREQLAQERADRKEAEDRLDAFKETLNEATDVLEKATDFNERLVAELTKRR